MRYVSFDGIVFDTPGECKDHEDRHQVLLAKMELVEKFLEVTRDDATDRTKNMVRNSIRKWLIWENETQGIPEPPEE